MRRRFLAILLLTFCIPACGYHVAGTRGRSALEGVGSLAIPIFKNDTRKPGIEAVIASAMADEFINVIAMETAGAAGAVMEGRVGVYELTPVAYSADEVLTEYRLTVVMSIRLVRRSDGKVLWQDLNMRDYEDFAVNTSSVMATKDAEAIALGKIANDAARLVRERVLEGF
ncbi:MAG: hypothetical protein HY890_06635 [Deltaproteobacteria bacterium]|nr:hypothetical protein [Deltaproteobacteria bacterium]